MLLRFISNFCLTNDQSAHTVRHMAAPLRVAIAGTGFIGAVHARSARLAGARIVGVSASSPSRSEEAARALGAERAFESSEALVEKMLDMAAVTSRDFVVDLGSGDGRNVIAAAKRGARATGFEFNPDMVRLSRSLAAKAGVSEKATFVEGDMSQLDQVFMNLCINGRDAMPNGGRLVVETEQVVINGNFAATHRSCLIRRGFRVTKA